MTDTRQIDTDTTPFILLDSLSISLLNIPFDDRNKRVDTYIFPILEIERVAFEMIFIFVSISDMHLFQVWI